MMLYNNAHFITHVCNIFCIMTGLFNYTEELFIVQNKFIILVRILLCIFIMDLLFFFNISEKMLMNGDEENMFCIHIYICMYILFISHLIYWLTIFYLSYSQIHLWRRSKIYFDSSLKGSEWNQIWYIFSIHRIWLYNTDALRPYFLRRGVQCTDWGVERARHGVPAQIGTVRLHLGHGTEYSFPPVSIFVFLWFTSQFCHQLIYI